MRTLNTLFYDVQEYLITFNVPGWLFDFFVEEHKLNQTIIYEIFDKLNDDENYSLNLEELKVVHEIAEIFVNDYFRSHSLENLNENYDEVLQNIKFEIENNCEGY